MSTKLSFVARRWTAPILAGVVVALSACGGGGYGGSTGGGGGVTNPGTNPVVINAVTISGSAFTPPDIQVAPSTAVTFTNNDGFNHNVTFTSSAVTSTGDFASGAKTVTLPATAGTYAYRCTIHAGMTGSVKVQ